MRRVKLIEARESKNLSQADLAEALQCSVDSVHRWEHGLNDPGLHARRQMQAFFGVEDLEELLKITDDEESDPRSKTILTLTPPNGLQTFFANSAINRLLCIAHTNYSTQNDMTNAIQTAIKDFDTMNLDPITRREALITLSALPMTTLGQKQPLRVRHYEETIRHCTAALEACWELYRGSDPVGTQHAFDCVSTYGPLLEAIARDSSQFRKEALDLATRYALLQTLLGWNCVGAKETVSIARHAFSLSHESSDILLQLSACSKLNYTYLMSKNYAEAWKTMQEGEHVLKGYQRPKKSPLAPGIIGNFYSSYSIAQVDNGLSPDYALGVATDSEPIRGHVALMEFTAFDQWWEAARACNSKGDPQQAMKWLYKLIDLETFVPRSDVPQNEGGRITAINTLTYSLLLLKERDMEYIIKTWIAGIEGAKSLKAEERYKKAMSNFEIMCALWPGEDAIRKLVPLTVHW
jgi:transcriptional regulator with XRE-family HTH domain